jgi:hypothetical protein
MKSVIEKWLQLGAAVALALMIITPATAGVIIAPTDDAATEGDLYNAFPFDFFSMRYQQVYNASQFGSIPLNISGVAFRPDAQFGSTFSQTFPNVVIKLSTTQGTVGGLSDTFATNEGADLTTVFQGALTLTSSFSGPANGPKNFDVLINFGTNFTYNPADGNLLLEVQNYGATLNGNIYLDAVHDSPETSRVYTIFGNDADTAVGESDSPYTDGLVTEFVTGATDVPEPISLLLLGGSLFGLGVLRRCKTES